MQIFFSKENFMNSKEFMQWFEQQIKTRWQGLRPSWIELGDWHWRLQEFDTDTLTQAARQHKATEDYRTPSLKKVYEYASKITAARKRNRPACRRRIRLLCAWPRATTAAVAWGGLCRS